MGTTNCCGTAVSWFEVLEPAGVLFSKVADTVLLEGVAGWRGGPPGFMVGRC